MGVTAQQIVNARQVSAQTTNVYQGAIQQQWELQSMIMDAIAQQIVNACLVFAQAINVSQIAMQQVL